MSDADIFAEEAAKAASEVPKGTVEHVVYLAKKAETLHRNIGHFEEALSKQKTELYDIERAKLPEAMAAIKQSSFTTEDGVFVEIKDNEIEGTLPKRDDAKRAGALQAIVDAGGKGIIKNQLIIEFGVGQEDSAADLAEALCAKGHAVSVIKNIHHQTLMSFLRQKVRDGSKIDLDAIGVSVSKIAKVVVPGLSKPKRKK